MMTKRQKQILDFIVGHFKEYLFFPSYREIGRAMGIGSTNGVSCHLDALERRGFIVRTEYRSRWFKLTDKTLQMYEMVWEGQSSGCKWMVVVKLEYSPVEVVTFDEDEYDIAVNYFEEVSVRRDSYLCRVVKGPVR